MKTKTRKRTWILLAAATVLATCCAAFLHSSMFLQAVESRISDSVSGFTGRECTLSLRSFSPFALRAEIEHLRIAGRNLYGDEFLSLDRGIVDLRWKAVLTGEPDLSELVLQGLRIDLDEIPALAGESSGGEARNEPLKFEDLLDRVRIDRASLDRGELSLDGADRSVELDATGIRVGLVREPRSSAYLVSLQVERGTLNMPDRLRLPFVLSAEAEMDDAGLEIDELDLTGAGIEVRISASWNELSPPTGSARVDLDVQMEEARSSVPGAGEIRGVIEATGAARMAWPDLEIDIAVRSDGIGWGSEIIDNLVLDWTGSHRGWDADFQGSFRDVDFHGRASSGDPWSLTPMEADLEFSSDDLRNLASFGEGYGIPEVAGKVHGSVQAEIPSDDLRAIRGSFELEAERLTWEDLALPEIRSSIRGSYSDGRIVLQSLQAHGAGADLRADGHADLTGESELRFRLESGDAGNVLRSLRSVTDRRGLASGVRGGRAVLSGHLSGPGLTGAALDRFTGEADLEARGITVAGEAGLPVDVRARLRLDAGRFHLAQAVLRSPGADLDLEGSIRSDGTGTADFRFSTPDVGDLATRLSAELKAMGMPEAIPPRILELEGTLDLGGTIRGHWRRPEGSIRLRSEGLGVVEGGPGRTLQADLRLDGGGVEAIVLLAGGISRFEATAVAGNWLAWPPSGTVRVDLSESDPAWWADLAGVAIPVDGRLIASGLVDTGQESVQATFEIEGGDFRGVPFHLEQGEIFASRQRLQVQGIRLHALGGTVVVDGELGTGENLSELRMEAEGLDLGELLLATGESLEADGNLSFGIRATGSPNDPTIHGEVRLADLLMQGHPLPALAGPVTYGSGRVGIDLEAPGDGSRIRATVETRMPTPWRAGIRYPVQLDPGRLAGGEADTSLVEGTLVADLEGEGADFGSIRGGIVLRGARMELSGKTMVPLGDPEIILEQRRLRLAPLVLTGEDLRLRVNGSLGLDAPYLLAADIRGTSPLGPLSGWISGLRVDGDTELEVRLSGPVLQPAWEGSVEVRKARITHPALPAPLEELAASVDLTRSEWRIRNLDARMGGGSVAAEGRFVASGDRAGDIAIMIRGEDVRLPLADGLRSEIDGTVTLTGKAGGSLLLAGNLEVARAAYVRDIELRRQLLAKVRTVAAGTEAGGVLDRLRLDLRVEAPDSIHVRNNLASLESRASLRIGATAADPRVSGEVLALEGGRLFFRGVTYQVVRGSLEYVSDPPGNPTIDLEGQTSVSQYDIRLSIRGRLEDPKLELSSSPSLSQADIVTLLVTGRTRDEIVGSGGGLAEAQAAQYLAGGLTREVEATLKRYLGLDQVRIDPVLVASETDPVARVTLGKSLSARAQATYSRALGGAEQDIYELRYRPTGEISVIGRRNEEGHLSAEVGYARAHYLGPRRAGVASGPAVEAKEILEIRFEGFQAVRENRLRKLVDIRPGATYRRWRLLEAIDSIGDWYLQNGYPEARIEAEVLEEPPGVVPVIRAEEGRRVRITIEGMKDSGWIRRSVLEWWRNEIFRDRIEDDAAAFIVRRLGERGYIRAEAGCRLLVHSDLDWELQAMLRPGPRVMVEEIVLEGNDRIPEDRILAEMLTEETRFLHPRTLAPGRLREDREAIQALYVASGYLDAEVGEPRITLTRSGKRSEVAIPIREGATYSLGGIRFSGNEGIDSDVLLRIAAPGTGIPYEDEILRRAREAVRNHYDASGYPDIRIEIRPEVDRERRSVDILFVVEEGSRRTVDSVEIVGAGLTRQEVIRRELELEPGDPWSADRIAASRQKLYRTGLFRSVQFREEPGEREDASRLIVQVEERPNVRTEYSVGYTTDEGARAGVTAKHINLLGRRLQLGVGGRISEVEWRLFAVARQSRLFGSGLDGLLSGSREREERNSFDVRRSAVRVQLDARAPDRKIGWFLGYGLQNVDLFKEGILLEPGTVPPPDLEDLIDPRNETALRLADLNAGMLLGSLDDFSWPTRGSALQARISIFDEAVLSEEEFLRAYVQWGVHRPLGRRWTWNSGLRLGAAEPYGISTSVPLSERFFAGGDNSIRGFRRDSIVASGFPAAELVGSGITVLESLGGNALLVLNQELVAEVRDPVSAVLFYDAGNLYWHLDDVDLSDLRHSAGLGIRVRTPVGPLRLEYGWKLDRQPEEDGGRLHFSIGMPF